MAHKDGPMKTATDISLNFQQMEFVMAPFGIAFRTLGPEFNSSTDAELFRNDELVISYERSSQ